MKRDKIRAIIWLIIAAVWTVLAIFKLTDLADNGWLTVILTVATATLSWANAYLNFRNYKKNKSEGNKDSTEYENADSSEQ